MSGTFCPRCAEPVRVPDDRWAAQVRCPWCRETYSLEEVAKRLPPELEVVESAPMSAEPRSDDHLPYGSFDALRGLEAKGESMPISTTAPRTSPRRRSSGSPILSAIKIALGGIAGCLLALMILQYLGRLPDLGFWPFRGQGVPMWQNADSRVDYWRGGRGRRFGGAAANIPNDVPSASDENLRMGNAVDLELPAFPLDDDVEPSRVVRLADRAETLIAEYRVEARRLDEEDQSDQAALESTADELNRLFQEIGQVSAATPGLTASDTLRLERVMDALLGDLPLLKQLSAVGMVANESRRAAESEGDAVDAGLIAFGLLDQADDSWVLKRSAADDKPYRLILQGDHAMDLRPGKLTAVIGTFDSAGAIQVGYAKVLAPPKG